ncbi:hypothetical protein JZ751_019022 [Albula glossodonta]|uniref:Uncharacterized protein n=1 Tax=Albula glossodonta TaxID=121402 RepID=A0A8T2NYQ1_9TELE|nr:hypothetical protein JZ751_019022 [Albula glossodonta]
MRVKNKAVFQTFILEEGTGRAGKRSSGRSLLHPCDSLTWVFAGSSVRAELKLQQAKGVRRLFPQRAITLYNREPPVKSLQNLDYKAVTTSAFFTECEFSFL